MLKILITGGCGFIGSHIADRLLKEGHDVSIIDNLNSTKGIVPNYLDPKINFIKGDLRDLELLKNIINKFDIIFHEASSVGIAQSNYEVDGFIDNNCLGTARLLQAIIDSKQKPKLIVSASNTSYGEGIYSCDNCGTFHPNIRERDYVNETGFEIVCPKCGGPSKPLPTNEGTALDCNSVYAYTKKFQEENSLFLGKLYGFPVVVLRYFNVFGPRQSLSNPYTGVTAIFASRIKNNQEVIVYEDGLQTRDFVYIDDVVEANILSMKNASANNKIFNIGSGKPITIKKVAEELYTFFNKKPKIIINKKFRKGDIRHCIADSSMAKSILNWEPKVSFYEGLKNMFEWSKNQGSFSDIEMANTELKERGLV